MHIPNPSIVKQFTLLYARLVAKSLKAMGISSVNIAPGPAMASQRWCAMSKELAVIRYRTAMTVFGKWLTDGIISEDELTKIDAIVAEKYGLLSHSIYRLNA